MPVLSQEEREAFLAERHIVMRIAVVRPDGSPLVTPIWFLYQDGAIHFTPRERSEWFACLRRDPRVALSIDEQPLPYRKVVIEGAAELLHDVGADAEWRDLYLRMARKYISDREADAYIQNTIDEPRGLYRVVLADAKVRSWRMPVKGEAGEGVWHQRYYRDPNVQFDGSARS
ncbi:MAG: pyridoxamine 5'-phosphate oxidase family protein [Alphaproteobacteria bacterium]|jgi:PPOX class probable F420-dependent enzyme|nr:pyridoxamine 5'-phosphate oxidase family protein [Alphaproteobacteria bacterium]MDP6816107.1 pyridoxamine 5'-phosphate oxidase family protein [Alphaproteobacteria bacterium]